MNSRHLWKATIRSRISRFMPVLLLMTSLSPICGAEPETWVRTIVGYGVTRAGAIDKSREGGFLVAGSSNDRVLVLKLSPTGEIKWQRTYGSPGVHATAISSLHDGSSVVTTNIYQPYQPWFRDWRVMRLDSDGDVLWDKAYSGPFQDEASSIVETADGGIAVLGNEFQRTGEASLLLVKLDKLGIVQWAKMIGRCNGHKLFRTHDSGFVVAGSVQQGKYSDALLLRLNSQGEILWQRVYGTRLSDYVNSIVADADGGFLIAGGIERQRGDKLIPNYDAWILKVSSSGKISWQQRYRGASLLNDMRSMGDGGVIVYADTHSFGSGSSDIWLLKLNRLGRPLWQKTYGGEEFDGQAGMVVTDDGGLALSALTNSFAGFHHAWLLRLNSDGNVAGGCPGICNTTNVSPMPGNAVEKNYPSLEVRETELAVRDLQMPVKNIIGHQIYQCSPIEKIFPRAAERGQSVVLQGSGFGTRQGDSRIYLGDLDVGVADSWSDHEVRFTVPKQARTGPLVVDLNGKKTSPIEFPVVPSLSQALWPINGPTSGSTSVVLRKPASIGDVRRVQFGTTPAANVRLLSRDLILCTAPPGTGRVSVRISDGAKTVTVGSYGYK